MTPIYTILDVVADNTYAPTMARMLLLIGIFIIIGSFAFSQTETFEQSDIFDNYYKAVQAYGNPVEGSSAERQISEYLASQAQSHGFSTQWQTISSEHEYHSFAANLQITIPGHQSKAIALLFPLDMPIRSTPGINNDPFLGPALACLLMERLSQLEIPQTIILEFLGAEDGQQIGLGSRNFIEKTPRENIALAAVISYTASVKSWNIIHGGEGKVSPGWLFELGLKVFSKAGIDVTVNTIESQLYRLSLEPEGMLTPLLRAGYPAIQIQPQPNSPTMDKKISSAALFSAIIDLVTMHSAEITESTNTHSWDANYLYVNVGGYRIISEKIIAIAFLASMIAYLLLIFLKRIDRHRYVASLTRNLPVFLIILFSCFLAFTVDTLLCLLFLPAYSLDPAYQQSIPFFFLGKMLTGLAIMLGLVRWFRHWLPGQSSFHAAAAFFTSISALIVVATIGLTVSVYLMAVTLFISLGNLSRSRFLKILFFVIAAVCILQPLFEALRLHPGFQIDRLLLRSVFPGAVLMTLIGIPFVFLWCRVALFLPLHRKLLLQVEIIFVVGLFLGGFFILIGNAISLRLRVDGMADLVVMRTIDQKSGGDDLLVTGAALLPSGSFIYEGQKIRMPFAHETLQLKLNAALPDKPVFTQTTRNFLGRKTLQLQISSKSGIATLALQFTANQELIVQSLNFPYKYLDARNIQIQIGRNPPPVIFLELTIPLDVSGTMQISTDSPDHLDFQPDNGPIHRIESIVRFNSLISWN